MFHDNKIEHQIEARLVIFISSPLAFGLLIFSIYYDELWIAIFSVLLLILLLYFVFLPIIPTTWDKIKKWLRSEKEPDNIVDASNQFKED
ncbi:MAG: hypothetical protein ABEJ24_05415 [Candidatus Magasanikbacteria bacterium]